MENQVYDTIIVGAGLAGVSAALTLYQKGIKNILVLEGKHNILAIVHSFKKVIYIIKNIF